MVDLMKVTTLIDVMTVIMMTLIIVVYGMATFWGIRFLLKMRTQPFCWIKMNTTIATGMMVLIYIYLFIKIFHSEPVDISWFSNIIIRPVIFYLGATLASAARARYKRLAEELKGEKEKNK